MSKLLIEEPPLQVLPSLAVEFGLNAAIVLQQLHYWLRDKRNGVEIDGERWIYNSYEEWQVQFPFWSIPTIQRAMTELEKRGVVISKQVGTDRRKNYRIDYSALPSYQIDTMEHIKLIRSKISKRYDVNIESETTPEKTTETELVLETPLSRVIKIYDANMRGDLTSLILDDIKSFLEDDKISEQWFTDAIKITASNGKGNWSYCRAILNNWRVNGRDDRAKPKTYARKQESKNGGW